MNTHVIFQVEREKQRMKSFEPPKEPEVARPYWGWCIIILEWMRCTLLVWFLYIIIIINTWMPAANRSGQSRVSCDGDNILINHVFTAECVPPRVDACYASGANRPWTLSVGVLQSGCMVLPGSYVLLEIDNLLFFLHSNISTLTITDIRSATRLVLRPVMDNGHTCSECGGHKTL